jgi:signal transduction histidine kinase
VTSFRGISHRAGAGRGTVLILVLGLFALLALAVYAAGRLGSALTAQVAVSFVVPALVMLLFWRAARKRLDRHEHAMALAIRLERVENRATGRFLVDVAHELTPHLERCSARDEALAVAVEYQGAGADIKVAVPDVEIETDPHILGQILHTLVGNAIRHGGGRIAIWAVIEGQSLRLNVSDDGPGLPAGLGDAVFERYVDLAGSGGASRRPGWGLTTARVLGEKIGAGLGYKRDPSWSHFSVRLPLDSAATTPADRIPLEAGAR